jgi:hypothetical protein
MKVLATLIMLMALSVPFATHADTSPPDPAPNESQLVEHGSYINKDGVRVHSPAHITDGTQPANATAKCRDGSYSFSKHHRGTCSHHGGVAHWLN